VAKQANGEGSIKRRADGKTWEARFTYADPATGETKRSSSYGRTRAEARAKMLAKRERVEAGQPVRDSRQTLDQFVGEWVASTLKVSDRKDSTKQTYSVLARGYLQGSVIGAVTLDRLKAKDVETLVASMKAKGLASSTIRQTYTVLRMVLDAAVRDQLVAHNVAAQVGRPRVEQVEARSLSQSEVDLLLAAADESGSRYARFIRLLVMTGLRRGEALALTWSDFVPDAGTSRGGALRVKGTLGRVGGELTITAPKTERSRRTIRLGARGVALLEEQRAAQDAERQHAGDAWVENGFVFATETGTATDPRNALRALTVTAKRAKLEDVGLHTLRHSAASRMLDAGIPLPDVSRILGHSSVAITGDIYGHPTTDGQDRAAEVLEAAWG
jgi:integrase